MKRIVILFVPLLLLLAAFGNAPAQTDQPPQVSDRYKAGIERAWGLAVEGQNPTNACAAVIGTAVGMAGADPANRAEALRAYEACYVDVNARYIEARLAGAETGTTDAEACLGLMTFMTVTRTALGPFATDLGLEPGESDARLAERSGERIQAACPTLASVILGV